MAVVSRNPKRKSSSNLSSKAGNQAQLDRALAKINASNSSVKAKAQAAAIAQGNKKPSGLAGAFSRFLDVVDTPRAAVVSGLSELSDLTADAFNLPGHEYTDASFGEFIKGTKDNIGFGTVFTEKVTAEAKSDRDRGGEGKADLFGLDLGQLNDEGEFEFSNGGQWAARGVGLVGDVGLDPLTYLTVGTAKVGKLGSEGIARVAAQKAINSSDGTWARIAQQAHTKGWQSLSKGDLAMVAKEAGMEGLEGGVRLNAPFTGKIGQKLGLAKTRASVQILPQSAVKYTPQGIYSATRGASKRTKVAEEVGKFLGGSTQSLSRKIVEGTPREAAVAIVAVSAVRDGKGTAKRFAGEVEGRWAELKQRMVSAGVDPHQAMLALEDRAGATTEVQALMSQSTSAQLIDELRAFSDSLPDTFNSTVEEMILEPRANWAPGIRSDDLREFYRGLGTAGSGGGGSRGFDIAGFEKRAGIVEGGTFMDEPILSAAESKAVYGEVLTPRAQAQRIIDAKMAEHGVDAFAMFEGNVYDAMDAHLRNMTRRVAMARTEKVLADKGVALNIKQAVQNPAAVADAVKIANLESKASFWRMFQPANEAAVEAAAKPLAAAKGAAAKADTKKLGAAVKAGAATRAERLANEAADNTIALAGRAEERAAAYGSLVGQALESVDNIADDVAPLKTAVDAAARETGELNSRVIRLEAQRAEAVRKIAGKATKPVEARTLRAKLMNEIEPELGRIQAQLRTINRDNVFAVVSDLEDTLKTLRTRRKELHVYLNAVETARAELGNFENAIIRSMDVGRAIGITNPDQAVKFLRGIESRLPMAEQALVAAKTELGLVDMAVQRGLDGMPTPSLRAAADRAAEIAVATGDPKWTQLATTAPKLGVGEGLTNPLHPEGRWYLANQADGGVTLTQNPQFAAMSAEVSVNAVQPRVYGLVPDVPADVRQALTGAPTGQAAREMTNDTLRSAWANKTIGPDDMLGHEELWRELKVLTDGGMDFDAAVASVFAEAVGRELRFVGIPAKPVAGQVTDAEWVVSRVADMALGADGYAKASAKTSARTTFMRELMVDYDSIVTVADDAWNVVPLNPNSVELIDGPLKATVEKMNELGAAAKTRIADSTEYARLVEKELGGHVDAVHGDLAKAFDMYADNADQLQRVTVRLSQTRKQALRDSLQYEFDERQLADQLFAEARKLREEAALASQDAQTLGLNAALVDVEHAELMAQVAEHEAIYHAAVANQAKANKRIVTVEQAIEKIKARDTPQEYFKNIMPFGMKKLGQQRYADKWLVDGIVDGSRAFNTEEVGKLLKTFDSVTNLWKGYAIMRPGFHFRNAFGGIFNNWLYGMETGSYKTFRSAWHQYNKAIRAGADHDTAIVAIKNADVRPSMDLIVKRGILTGGQSQEVKIAEGLLGKRGGFNPLSSKNYGIRGNRRASEAVENELRGALALDTMMQGGSIDDAIGNVAKFHFDYDDLSKFERNTVKRVIPFYTWSRKNLPLQLEMLFTKPQSYTRFLAFKRNVELGTEEESLYPNWFNDTLNMRLPFKTPGGDQVYLMPDLPYKDITKTFSTRQLLSQVNPLIKTPAEIKAGKQFYSDIPFRNTYQPIPKAWEGIGVPQLLGRLGKAERDSDGNWRMRDTDMYIVEQALPLLGAARRQIPVGQEDKYNDRILASWGSYFFGIGTRANTQADQAGELYRRTKKLDKAIADQKSLGTNVPDYEDIAPSSSKASKFASYRG